MPYASWPYDKAARSETNTLRGRFGLAHGDEYSSDPYRPGPQSSSRQDAVPAPEPYRCTLSSIIRSARVVDR
jgi:hypothetical protein